jgi:hypothetical protein
VEPPRSPFSSALSSPAQSVHNSTGLVELHETLEQASDSLDEIELSDVLDDRDTDTASDL